MQPTQEPAAPPRTSRGKGIGWRKELLVAAALFAVTAAVFSPALRNGFVAVDDPVYVTENAAVRGGLTARGAAWAFTMDPVSGNWHPLTWLSHMLDCQAFGLRPWGHHLTSVLLHAANAALLFAALNRMTRAPWRSLFAAALFALHPLRVESVAWVAERKDVLSLFFLCLTLLSWQRFVMGALAGYLLALLFFAGGLMAKPMLVTLPLLLLLLDRWPLHRTRVLKRTTLVMEKALFIQLAVASCTITYLAQHLAGAMKAGSLAPFSSRLENIPVAYCRYLGKIFWPTDLAYFYPHPVAWPLAEVALATVALAAATAVAIALRRRYEYLATGWFWFLLTLVPVIGLVQVGSQSMADRYTYLPSIGIGVIVVWAAADWAGGARWRRVAVTAAGVAALIACAAATVRQIGYWKDSETLFRRATAVTAQNFPAHSNLAVTLLREKRVDEAIPEFQAALEIFPGDVPTLCSLGMTLVTRGRVDEGISEYQKALRADPNSAEAHGGLGAALIVAGRADEAQAHLQRAVELDPGDAPARLYLGLLLEMEGRLDDAIAQFREALRIQPGNGAAQAQLAAALKAKSGN